MHCHAGKTAFMVLSGINSIFYSIIHSNYVFLQINFIFFGGANQ